MSENVKEVENNVTETKETKGQIVTVSREFNVDSDFNDKLGTEFLEWCQDVSDFDELFKEQYPNEELQPVIINIMSRGGQVDTLNLMLDALDDLDCPIITRVVGYAYSCGFFLFVRGDVRLMGNNSRIMYHQILYGADGNLQDHKENLAESERLMKNIDKMMVSRTKLTQKELDKCKREKRDWFFDKQDAVNYGIVNFDGRLKDLFVEEDEKTIEELTEED